MTTAIVSRPNSGHKHPAHPFNGSKFVGIGKASDYLGISQPTCRLLVESGELESYRTIGNQRRISVDSLLNYALGDDWQSVGDTEKKIIGMIRVSSRGQATAKGNSEKSSLDHQRERIITYCLETHGREPDEIIESVGSGLNFDRPEFVDLMKRIVSGELRGATIVATDFTRVCRFGVRLVEHLAEYGGCSIEYTMADEQHQDQDDNESLVQDVLSVLTHFTARVSGKKTAKILTIHVDPEAMKRGWEIYQQQKSYRATVRILEQEGFRDSRGNPFKVNILRKSLIQNQDSLTELFGGNQTESSFEKFAREHVRKGKPTDAIRVRDVMTAYHRWCQENGNQNPQTKVAIGNLTKKKLGWKWTVRKGKMFYLGIVLDG